MSGAVALLRRRPQFRALWAAIGLSYAGSGAATTALTLYVQQTHGTGTAVAAFLIASQLPRLLGPLTGGIADRTDLRTLLIGCDLGQAVVFAAIATLPSFGVIIGLTALATVLQTSYAPARTAMVPNLVEPEELIEANALLGTATNLYVAIGPLVGGLLFAAIGPAAGILVNAVTFLGSAALTTRVPPTRPSEETEHEPLFVAARTGARFVWHNRLLRTVTLSLLLLVAFLAVDNVALVFLVRETLGGSAFTYGLMEAVFGVGMLAGSLWILRGRAGTWGAPRLYLLSCSLSSAGAMGAGLAPSVAVLAPVEAVAGAGNGIEIVAGETIIQQEVPRGMIGRVYGFTSSATSLGVGVAQAAGGLLVDATSPRAAFLIAAAGGVLITMAIAPTMLRVPTPASTAGAAGG
ncbi:MAG: MFS transporter [Actinobacteria bacterium]|nr:MFS transporter [Actinomycetota bacterium]